MCQYRLVHIVSQGWYTYGAVCRLQAVSSVAAVTILNATSTDHACMLYCAWHTSQTLLKVIVTQRAHVVCADANGQGMQQHGAT